MKAARTLRLRRESLGELSTDDLRDLAGNGTDTCVETTVSTLTVCNGGTCDLVERTRTITDAIAIGTLPTGYTPCYTLLCR